MIKNTAKSLARQLLKHEKLSAVSLDNLVKMKGLKKLFAMLLTVLLAISLSSGVVCAGANREAEQAAWELYRLGLFLGIGTDQNGQPVFALDRPATRSEAVTMLVRLLGAEEDAKAATLSVPFSDVEAWAKPYVGYAYAKGLTAGTSGTTFSGSREINATEYLSFVLRALGYQSGSDFQWNAAWKLTDQLGITHGEYKNAASFLRSDIVIVSRNALSTPLKGQTVTLLEACTRHEGQEPNQRNLPDPEMADISGFEIHFLDVGEADSALILCDGHAMLVDGGNAADSSLVYSYLRELNISYLDYIVCTHVHEDHVGGLAGALNFATVGKAYCSETEYNTRAFSSFLKYLDQQGVSITVPYPGETFQLGSASVMIVGPISLSDNHNNNSIVLRIQYGSTSFLLTGDAERAEEAEIIEAGFSIQCTLLKVGHHGSATSTSYPFLYYAEPRYAVISVGRGNSYGHPSEDTLSRLRDADVTVFRTDELGTIVCKSDGEQLTFYTEKPWPYV